MAESIQNYNTLLKPFQKNVGKNVQNLPTESLETVYHKYTQPIWFYSYIHFTNSHENIQNSENS